MGISRLNPSFGSEVWINKTLEHEIESAIKEQIENEMNTLVKRDEPYKCEGINYFYYSCPGTHVDDKCKTKGTHEMKWFGIGLIPFIRKVQSLEYNAPMIYATSHKNKGQVERGLSLMSISSIVHDANIYWIGDCARDNGMICCDNMFRTLWNRIRDKVANNNE